MTAIARRNLERLAELWKTDLREGEHRTNATLFNAKRFQIDIIRHVRIRILTHQIRPLSKPCSAAINRTYWPDYVNRSFLDMRRNCRNKSGLVDTLLSRLARYGRSRKLLAPESS